jgi:hypothetical protein
MTVQLTNEAMTEPDALGLYLALDPEADVAVDAFWRDADGFTYGGERMAWADIADLLDTSDAYRIILFDDFIAAVRDEALVLRGKESAIASEAFGEEQRYAPDGDRRLTVMDEAFAAVRKYRKMS